MFVNRRIIRLHKYEKDMIIRNKRDEGAAEWYAPFITFITTANYNALCIFFIYIPEKI